MIFIQRDHNIQAFPGLCEASGEEISQGASGINLLQDADEEAVDDVEEGFEQEVRHDEDEELVDADDREPADEKRMQQALKESETQKVLNGAQVKRRQKKSIRIGGKGKQYPCDQSDCTKMFSWASSLHLHIKVVHKKEGLHTCNQEGCLIGVGDVHFS